MEADVSLVGWHQTGHNSFHVLVIMPHLSYSSNVRFLFYHVIKITQCYWKLVA